MASITQSKASDAIINCEPFNAGTLTGAWVSLDYVVMSYGVVIASFDGARWTLNESAQGISNTTRRHLNIVRRAIA